MAQPATPRPKVPVAPDDFRLIREDPAALGLDPAASEAARLQQLLHEGVLARLERMHRARRREIYEEWANDPENRAAVAAVRADTVRHGGTLRAFKTPQPAA